MAAQLDHPAIGTAHAIEEHNGALFIAMESIDGRPFGAAMRSRALSDLRHRGHRAFGEAALVIAAIAASTAASGSPAIDA